MSTDTSLQAWMEIQPVLGERQLAVYLALKRLGPMSNMEISKELDWSVSCVTPRVCELRKARLVVDNGVRPCRVTGRSVHIWRVVW